MRQPREGLGFRVGARRFDRRRLRKNAHPPSRARTRRARRALRSPAAARTPSARTPTPPPRPRSGPRRTRLPCGSPGAREREASSREASSRDASSRTATEAACRARAKRARAPRSATASPPSPFFADRSRARPDPRTCASAPRRARASRASRASPARPPIARRRRRRRRADRTNRHLSRRARNTPRAVPRVSGPRARALRTRAWRARVPPTGPRAAAGVSRASATPRPRGRPTEARGPTRRPGKIAREACLSRRTGASSGALPRARVAGGTREPPSILARCHRARSGRPATAAARPCRSGPTRTGGSSSSLPNRRRATSHRNSHRIHHHLRVTTPPSSRPTGRPSDPERHPSRAHASRRLPRRRLRGRELCGGGGLRRARTANQTRKARRSQKKGG